MQSRSSKYQTRLFDLSVSPGDRAHRISAAFALLIEHDHVEPQLVTNITPNLLLRLIAEVASRLLLLLTLRGGEASLMSVVQVLAADSNRRVFLLLALWVALDGSQNVVAQITNLLPPKHPAVVAILEGNLGILTQHLLQDLGDEPSVDQVLKFMRTKT